MEEYWNAIDTHLLSLYTWHWLNDICIEAWPWFWMLHECWLQIFTFKGGERTLRAVKRCQTSNQSLLCLSFKMNMQVIWLKLLAFDSSSDCNPSWPLQWRQRRWQRRPWKVRRSWPRERFWVSWPMRRRWRRQTSAKSWTHWLRSAPRRWRSLASSFSLACAWSRLAQRQLSKEAALCEGIQNNSVESVISLRRARVWTTLARLREMTDSTELFWIPSHGKIKSSWIPHAGATEFQLRAWNAKADAVANQAARARAQGSARESWNTACYAARDYEHRVIHAAAAVHAHYRQFLQQWVFDLSF